LRRLGDVWSDAIVMSRLYLYDPMTRAHARAFLVALSVSIDFVAEASYGRMKRAEGL
jgi:hypothetical protein